MPPKPITIGERPHPDSTLRYVAELPPSILPSGRAERRVRVVCDCGNESITSYQNVKSGHTLRCKECGSKVRAAKRTNQVPIGSRTSHDSMLTFVAEVDRYVQPNGRERRMVLCRCDCGTEITISLENALHQNKSCGCTSAARTHGMHDTPFYTAWENMIARCKAPVQERHATYRGVTHCPEWATFDGFAANQPTVLIGNETEPRAYFPGAVLGRVGDTGNYEPGNTRWQTKAESHREALERRMVRLADGRFLVDVLREQGREDDRNTILGRIARGGMTPDEALNTPIRHR